MRAYNPYNASAGLCLFCNFRAQGRREFTTSSNKSFRLRYGAQRPPTRPFRREQSRKDREFEETRPRQTVTFAHSPQVGRLVRGRIADKKLIQITIKRLDNFTNQLADPIFLVKTGLVEDTAKTKLAGFRSLILETLRSWENTVQQPPDHPLILGSLRRAYSENAEDGIDAQLKFALQGFVANSEFTRSDLLNQARLADLRYPYEWYPATRAIQRKIHLHVGPTNSGKTYHALKRLEAASSGVYAGPLRLLAHEVYSRLNALGKPCNLVTGDERVLVEGEEAATMASCTVEMVSVNRDVEVAVVDEIQMIGNDHRGWAWTQAVLGLKAQELHLCGEERAVPLIRELAAAMGDQLEIHHYERLSPLRTMSTSLNGDLHKLRKGDCLVVFSRMQIHSYRQDIEKITGKRVAVVYGSLPPEIRAQQARLFNDPDNEYDILVASDAIGMGLNLSIKRIIFESTTRHNGEELKTLQIPDIKQISGRAGRYRTAVDAQKQITETAEHSPAGASVANLGLVTTLESVDLPIVQRALQTEAGPIETAGIFPPDSIVIKFSKYFPPETPFSYILLRLHEIARMHPRFYLCNLRDYVGISDVIQQVKNLTIADRIALCGAPVDLKSHGSNEILLALSRCVADQTGGALLDIQQLKLEILDKPVTAEREYLRDLESLHKSLVLYLWLSYRFVGIFPSQDMAFHVKRLTEEKIDKVLTEFSTKKTFGDHLKRMREQAILQAFRTQSELQEDQRLQPDPPSLETVEVEDKAPPLVPTTLHLEHGQYVGIN